MYRAWRAASGWSAAFQQDRRSHRSRYAIYALSICSTCILNPPRRPLVVVPVRPAASHTLHVQPPGAPPPNCHFRVEEQEPLDRAIPPPRRLNHQWHPRSGDFVQHGARAGSFQAAPPCQRDNFRRNGAIALRRLPRAGKCGSPRRRLRLQRVPALLLLSENAGFNLLHHKGGVLRKTRRQQIDAGKTKDQWGLAWLSSSPPDQTPAFAPCSDIMRNISRVFSASSGSILDSACPA